MIGRVEVEGRRVTASTVEALDDLSALTRARLITLIRATVGDGYAVHLGLSSHMNVGDLALSLAETGLVESSGVAVGKLATCDQPSVGGAPAGPRAAFVLQGGGNIGDIYPSELSLRLDVLRAHPKQPILQMPQSLYFRDHRNAEDFRRLVGAAKNYVLLVRDLASHAWATQYLDCEIELVPDSVLSLGRLHRPRATDECVALLREDVESAAQRAGLDGVADVVDWPGWDERSLMDWLAWPRWARELSSRPTTMVHRWLAYGLYTSLIQHRFRRGREVLARGRYVVTDRLHGHILSTLMGIPHVVMDNSYGKVFGFMDTWQMDRLTAVRRVHAATPEEVRAALADLRGERQDGSA